jgi:microcystin-dependent protein
MSEQKIKDIPGGGRSISKEISTIERATPNIISMEGRMQALESWQTQNGLIDEQQTDDIELLQTTLPGIVPVGTILMTGATSAPTGFLICNGSFLSTSVWPDLFAKIGYTFGGSGASFKLPDFRGRSPIGVGIGAAGYASVWGLGEMDGAEKHQLTIAQLPAHYHTVSEGNRLPGGSGQTLASGDDYTNSTAYVSASGYTGSDEAHNNMHPVLGINFIIKF